VGIPPGSGRFTFDIPLLYRGLQFITIAVGMFAQGEVFTTIFKCNITVNRPLFQAKSPVD